MSAVVPPEPTGVCPGCGSVLVTTDDALLHPGASTSCARLFATTLRGVRDESPADPAAAAVVALADAAYDAQHPVPGDDDRLRAALDRLGAPDTALRPPPAWRTTIADVAADLDVIDLPVLVESWAAAVREDWAGAVAASG
jgi:hypothetical protein